MPKVTVTLNDEDWTILKDALQIIRPDAESPGVRARSRLWLIRWAVRAVAAEILRTKHMPCPLAVQWRDETAAEEARRLGETLPYQDGSAGEQIWSRF